MRARVFVSFTKVPSSSYWVDSAQLFLFANCSMLWLFLTYKWPLNYFLNLFQRKIRMGWKTRSRRLQLENSSGDNKFLHLSYFLLYNFCVKDNYNISMEDLHWRSFHNRQLFICSNFIFYILYVRGRDALLFQFCAFNHTGTNLFSRIDCKN